ncbi:PREDICTED: glutamate receptor ionotropic, kainate 5-like, partial [Ficedula albicollis]|uniref:glutamate receptor ionotropic, kainate 5-like n=1 Tax=Ficedula albicollis TaxID=59894 RepID=UPI0007AD8C77
PNFPPQLSAALLFDAVHVVVGAVRELNRSQEIGGRPLGCTAPGIWPHDTSLMNYLRMVEYDGLTGRVEFNSKGQRTNYSLRVLEKGRDGHREVGVWFSNRTLAMDEATLALNASDSLANKTLIITTILENPYVMRVSGASGQDRFEGFCVDMLRELAALLKFRFHIKLVEDGLYGAPEPNGSWTGMVGELINRKADLDPYPQLTPRIFGDDFGAVSGRFRGASAGSHSASPQGRKPGYFSFLDPFSPAVWLFMLLAYLAVSCVLFLAASPNSLWFPVGGFLQQGAEVLPRALSTRCVSGVWWAFTLIIISSYTANLAAFLTVQRMEVPVESADDLADQTNIEYGTIHAGSTMTFFQVRAVSQSIDHFFWISPQFSGSLPAVPPLVIPPLPAGSPFRDEITLAILQLQENNRLEILKRKWWEGGHCPKEEDHRAKGLGMENIGGIFVVLVCGLLVAILVAVMEFPMSPNPDVTIPMSPNP